MLTIATIAATSALGASSGTVVSATIPSALQLTNGCTASSATTFGTVLPGTGATTDTGAGRCIVSWSSSNDSSMLRIAQRDGVGAAMSRPSTFSNTTDWSQWEAVDTADGTSVVAGGNGGIYGRSANAGATWTTYATLGGNSAEITDIEQVPGDATGAWAVGFGNRVQRITNALGVPSTTNRRTQLEAAGWPAGVVATQVAVIDVDSAFVGGDDGWVAKTDNDGVSWTAYQMPSSTNVEALSLAPTGHVWMATRDNPGGNIFRALVTGGASAASWTQYNAGLGSGINDLHVSGANNGYAVGDAGLLFSWDGTSWTWRGTAVEPNDMRGVASPAGVPATAVMVGTDGSMLRTTNGGVSWTRLASPVGSRLTQIASGSAGMIAVGLARSTLSSTDGAGATWTFQSDLATARGRRSTALEPVDGKIALAVGTRGTIWRSTDGGATWGTITSGTTQPLFGVAWASRTLAWAAGGNGTILRSDDAGLTWSSVASGTNVRLQSISAGSPDQVIAVGDDATTVRSTNGGSSFTVATIGGAPMLHDVSMATRLIGIVVGDNYVRRTTDGGATWIAPTSAPPAERMTAVSMANATTAYATGAWNSIWKSTNGGDTWTRTIPGMGSIFEVHAVTSDLAYVAGNDLWSTRDGTTWSLVPGAPSWNTASVAGSDENHVIIGSDVGGVAVRTASVAGADQIPDYGAAPNSWVASAQAMFGVCLQAVGAQTTPAAPWVVDGGTCTGSDTDPWRALPATPTKIAGVTVAGNSGQVELVWGVRFPATQAPGRYTAGVVFEAVAPNA